MRVLVVSRVPGLAAAIGSRLEVHGIDPVDLPVVLQDEGELSGAVVECATLDKTIQAAELIRQHDPWAPIVLLVGGDSMPDRTTTQALEPVRLVRRPFTTAQLVDHLVSMRRGVKRPDVAVPDVTPTDAPRHAAPAPQERVESGPRHRRPRQGWRARRAQPQEPTVGIPRDALRLLSESDLPPSVPDAAQQLLRAVHAQLPASTAVAVLVLDGRRWTVEAGRGLRLSESRIVIEPTSWLASHVAGRDSAVVVTGTDVARQELHGVPLIHLEHWMAATMADSTVMVVLGRDERPAFRAEDALGIRDATRALVTQLDDAVEVRRLARLLAPYA